MKKVLFLANHDVGIYNFRKELVERLIKEGYKVYLSCPNGERIKDLVSIGCRYIDVELERHGMNPLNELKLIIYYKRIMRKIRPDVVLSYTVKPNVYGGMAAAALHIPQIANITGLGSAIECGGVLKRITLLLYKIGLHKAETVFFQNKENMKFMKKNRTVTGKKLLLPGSGVNLEQHCFEEYPDETEKLIFLSVGRIMKDKGIDELLEAAGEIKKEFPNVRFRLIGFFDEDYESKIKAAVESGLVEYLGQQENVHSFIKQSHAVIHASYHEGMSNVLLESAASGRPVIATNIPGCIETFEPGISGIACNVRDGKDLTKAIKSFIQMPHEGRARMGKAGRRKMEQEFDRQIVVNKYMKEIKRITEE